MFLLGPPDLSGWALALIVTVYGFVEGFAVLGGGLLRARRADTRYLHLSLVRLATTLSVGD